MKNLISGILLLSGLLFLICENNPLDGTKEGLKIFFLVKLTGVALCGIAYLIGRDKNDRKEESRHHS